MVTAQNPLFKRGLTSSTVLPGMKIKTWIPGEPTSERNYTLVGTPYVDEEETMVIDLIDEQGSTVTRATSEVGLSGCRETGTWTHIAMEQGQVHWT